MNNLEKIKKAWAMGWSAVIGDFVVIGFVNGVPWIRSEYDDVDYIGALSKNHSKITGYKYAGELAGNELIPKGQKFMEKASAEIWKFDGKKHTKNNRDRVGLVLMDGMSERTICYFDKSAIEPVFK